MEKINIWYGSGDNRILSNLAYRPFKDKQKQLYISVEHLYQCWKSGTFDEECYNKPWKDGSKFIGNYKVNTDISFELMYRAMFCSFCQNDDAGDKLLSIKTNFTHKQDRTVWRVVFPKLLRRVRRNLRYWRKDPKSFKIGETKRRRILDATENITKEPQQSWQRNQWVTVWGQNFKKFPSKVSNNTYKIEQDLTWCGFPNTTYVHGLAYSDCEFRYMNDTYVWYIF